MALIVNFDKYEYIKPTSFGEKDSIEAMACGWDGAKTALCVLLADGNNRGGGDLRSDQEIIGSWAGCRIGVIDETLVDDTLGLPGQAGIPLQEQFLCAGRDVSAAVLAALKEGEGDYYLPNQLMDDCVFSKVTQRELWGEGVLKLIRDDAPLTNAMEFFSLLGASYKFSVKKSRDSLQLGINRLAGELGLPQGYRVTALELKKGLVKKTSPWQSETESEAVATIALTVEPPTGRTKTIKVGFKGTSRKTPNALFKAVFGIQTLKLETPSADDVAAKAFVANLLNNVQGA